MAKRKKTNPRKLNGGHASVAWSARQAAERYVSERVDEIASEIARDYLLILMLVLHDEYGFGKRRIMHVYTRVCDLSDSVSKGLMTFEDVRQALIDECKWDIDKACVERKEGEAYWRPVEEG